MRCWSSDLDQPIFAWYSQMLVKQRQEVLGVMMVAVAGVQTAQRGNQ